MECLGELWAFLDVISDSCEPFVGSGLEARNQPGLEFNQSIYIYVIVFLQLYYSPYLADIIAYPYIYSIDLSISISHPISIT